MDDQSPNPYAPPTIEVRERATVRPRQRRYDWVALTSWPVALGLNVIVPVMFGAAVTDEAGHIGMGLALLLWLVAGWGLCVARPMEARKLVLGSLLLAWTQLFPIIQMFAGLIAMALVGLSFNVGGDVDSPRAGWVGAFLVSNLVAAMLLPIAAGIGWLAAALLPRNWFEQSSE